MSWSQTPLGQRAEMPRSVFEVASLLATALLLTCLQAGCVTDAIPLSQSMPASPVPGTTVTTPVEESDDAPSLPPATNAEAAAGLRLDSTDGLIAYQMDGQLWLDTAKLSGDPVSLLTCDNLGHIVCSLPRIHWAPDGSHFLYFLAVEGEYRLILSDSQGKQQTYRLPGYVSREPVWSPDSSKVIYFVQDAERPWGNHDNRFASALEYGFMEDIWQVQMTGSGAWSAPQKVASLATPGSGCGGGGISISDSLYDLQDGFALGYEAARKMAWAIDGVIVYPLTCDYWQGYGRLDTQTWQPLAPYDGHLRGLTFDSSGSRWYAVTGHNRDLDPASNRLVTGTSASTEYEAIETAVPVEMVFVGSESGHLYYTAREQLAHKDVSDQNKWGKPVPPYFNFYRSQLWTMLPDGNGGKLLWESADHSCSRLAETPQGDLLFVLVENDNALYEVISSGAPEEEWSEHLPRTYVMRLSLNSSEPVIWLEDAHNLATWFQ